MNGIKLLPSAAAAALALCLMACGGGKKKKPSAGGRRAMPVKVEAVAPSPVPVTDTYVATIKSRRSATIQPQISGNITQIFVHSGDKVHAGDRLMEIDPRLQEAIVAQQKATEQQALAVYQYNKRNIARQRKLFSAGIISKQALQQANQAYASSKATYESDVAALKSAQRKLAYYQIDAPFTGIVGDIPVHIGDYVSPTTVLTTVNDDTKLEAYIYIPTARASDIRVGLPVEITTSTGKVLDRTKVYFVSPQVNNDLQAILVKAKVRSNTGLRNAQAVRAKVIWSKSPSLTVPILAVTQIGNQQFVFVAQKKDGHYVARQVGITVGETVKNSYEVTSGLKPGEKVILSGLQLLADGEPVKPIS